MATLAIQGHKTRGSEVIALLKMLGGKNTYQSIANTPSLYYYIAETYGVEVDRVKMLVDAEDQRDDIAVQRAMDIVKKEAAVK